MLITLISFAAAAMIDTKSHAQPAIFDCPSAGVISRLDETHYVLSSSIAPLVTCIDRTFFRFGQRWEQFVSIRDGGVNGSQLFNIQTGTWIELFGLQSGDLIEKIDGRRVDVKQLPKACLEIRSKFIKGKPFTITLALSRHGHRFNIIYHVVP